MQRIIRLYNYIFEKYEWLLSFLLRIDILKIRRDRYTRKVVRRFFRDDEQRMYDLAMATSLSGILDERQQRKCYRRIVTRYASIAFLSAFISTFPEELGPMVIACIVDFIVFQIALYSAMQKILMLYGEDCDLSEDEDAGVEKIISIESSGLMMGKYPIMQKMKSVAGWLTRKVIQRLGPILARRMSGVVFAILRRQSIKWTTVIVAKRNLDSAFELLVPVSCAFVSGIVSVVIFIPMCNKLRRHLSCQES